MLRHRKVANDGASLVYDVRRNDGGFTEDTLLQHFAHPVPTKEPLEATLHHADGTTFVRRLPTQLRHLPTEILYDVKGLQLFDSITKLEEYYLTRCEREIISHQMAVMVQYVPDGASLIELGCGNMSKTAAILDHLYAAGKKDLSFYALDIDATYLMQSVLTLVETEFGRGIPKEYSIDYAGILGSYDEALDAILSDIPSPRVFLWLGSSIGNCTREGAEDLVGRFGAVMEPRDLFIVGIDKRNDPVTVARAYNDAQGVSAAFGLNGIHHLNHHFPTRIFPPENFDYYAGYNAEEGRHEAYYRSLVDQIISIPATESEAAVDVHLKKNELIRYEMSYKYSIDEMHRLGMATGFHLKNSWSDAKDMYRLCLFEKTQLPLMQSGMPILQDWRDVWHRWDVVSGPKMIKNYNDQPIHLRHPIVFYAGHIPAFCDILISKGLKEPLTEPVYYKEIFERGIDPDVEDPSVCHPHSAVPESWPSLDAILDYKRRVRERVIDVYRRKERGEHSVSSRQLGRVLNMALEHEIMHTETLLYMLVQSHTIDPPIKTPSFNPTPEQLTDPRWMAVNGGEVVIGLDEGEEMDAENEEVAVSFGWDNESPSRSINVDSFQIQHRPVTNLEYFCFLKMLPSMPEHLIPSSFSRCEDSSTYGVKTVFGVVPMKQCMNWPAALNYHQALAFMKHLQISLKDNSIHIPTEAEMHRLYDQFRSLLGSDMNIGFSHWCPTDLTNEAVHVMGSMWEWTSTELEAHSGFVPSALYPGYSTDFFDGKHNVVKGGSWATHPRLVGRLRNFYQRSYGYAFTGVRFARCLEE